MTVDGKIRQYIVLKTASMGDRSRASIEKLLHDSLGPFSGSPMEFEVLPFADWKLSLEYGDSFESRIADSLVISLGFESKEAAGHFRTAVEKYVLEKAGGGIFDRAVAAFPMGAALPMHVAERVEHWCPREAPFPIFGNRTEARRLIHADYLAAQHAKGQNVNVVVVDRGVDKDYILSLGATFGGGWSRTGLPLPGCTVGGHGKMIVRNILNIAPQATIFDCPLLGDLPGHITDIEKTTSDAANAYNQMIDDIDLLRLLPRWQGPWIFENAWAVYDRNSEHPFGNYTNRPGHVFNQSVTRAVTKKIDVVFCAGNCGQFCPDPYCGANDRGPGESILGANSHPGVFTVSAVRTDTIWLGYSSQGPGQSNLDPGKPDFAAPSQFCEVEDVHATNTGTSAACALTAGVVAALRSKWDCNTVSTARLKQVLKDTATKTKTGTGWQGRLGSGVLNAEAAFKALP